MSTSIALDPRPATSTTAGWCVQAAHVLRTTALQWGMRAPASVGTVCAGSGGHLSRATESMEGFKPQC